MSAKFVDVVIASAARTPIGAFRGLLSSVSAPKLGAIAVRSAIQKAGIDPNSVEACIMGNVISSGLGQAPARQAAIHGGLNKSTTCTTINKVCSSGMKSIMYAAQSIMLGQNQIVVAGGFESMSNVPYYSLNGRSGLKYGHQQLIDGIIHDGLWDAFDDHHMGSAGENCASKYNISRKEQDEFATLSYKRAADAWQNGRFESEIVPVQIDGQKKGEKINITEDEEFKKIDFSKMSTLRTAFKSDGTITAANASSINDGGAALVLMSASAAKLHGVKPLARIIGFADAEQEPIDFPTAPAAAVPKALGMAGVKSSEIDLHEINEAFSVVVLANMKLLGLPIEKVNVDGGAVSLGHPIGMSGARIVSHLAYALNQKNLKLGCASICNGGGGASAIILARD
eukprot:TRINITY_DN8908_c0_g1_i1.p1 TRINITY_DN8908_c0_g1~~TRINITY_DN8908_c0_g1_i1.p1  ORF type:complete len:398 (-),score=242.65 TRINITY_DN8908_c0_g1_i1:79-1272(-)